MNADQRGIKPGVNAGQRRAADARGSLPQRSVVRDTGDSGDTIRTPEMSMASPELRKGIMNCHR